MQEWRVTATFWELPAAHAEQIAYAKAANLRVAIGRALAEIVARPELKGKHIRRVQIGALYLRQVNEGQGG